jgi:4'-phosphopantetheinyl transferase
MSRQFFPLPPGEGRVDFWFTPLARIADEALVDACWKVLSGDEAERARRFAFDRDRRLYVVAHALVRTVLSRYADVAPGQWRFKTVGHGKPIVDPAHGVPLRFNLSHTRGMAVCGVTVAGSLGVDVEFLGRQRSDLKLARRYFAPAESDTLVGLAPEEMHRRFLDYWTLKESYIKAIGAGLSLPLDSFAFRLSREQPPAIWFTSPEENPQSWQFAQMQLGPEHVAALALECDAGPLVVHAAEAFPLSPCEPCRPLPPSVNHRWSL